MIRYFQGFFSMGFFSVIGLAILSGQFSGNGSVQSELVLNIARMFIDPLGLKATSLILIGIGVISSFYFVILKAEDEF